MIIIPDLPDVQVEEVEVAFEITPTIRTTSPTAACPSCGTASSRVQSRYTRTLRDLLHQSKKSQDRKHKYKNRQGPHVDRLKKPGRMKHGKELLMESPAAK